MTMNKILATFAVCMPLAMMAADVHAQKPGAKLQSGGCTLDRSSGEVSCAGTVTGLGSVDDADITIISGCRTKGGGNPPGLADTFPADVAQHSGRTDFTGETTIDCPSANQTPFVRSATITFTSDGQEVFTTNLPVSTVP
jgi:hypothetical protein